MTLTNSQWKEMKNISRRDREIQMAYVIAICNANNLDVDTVLILAKEKVLLLDKS